MALRRLGDVDGAARAAFAAVDGQPDYREGYYRLAECYLAAGAWTKAIHWAELGLGAEDPPRFVFKNPLDTSVNARTILGEAFGRIGHVTEARRQLEQAHAVAPTPELAGAIAEYARIEAASQAASAFCHLGPLLPEDALLAAYRGLPDDVKSISRVRDLVIPVLMKRREERYAA
jgi:tetratricopeptide (TPR) repeat protein